MFILYCYLIMAQTTINYDVSCYKKVLDALFVVHRADLFSSTSPEPVAGPSRLEGQWGTPTRRRTSSESSCSARNGYNSRGGGVCVGVGGGRSGSISWSWSCISWSGYGSRGGGSVGRGSGANSLAEAGVDVGSSASQQLRSPPRAVRRRQQRGQAEPIERQVTLLEARVTRD